MGLEGKTLIFIHIPKAGGITLCHTLLRQYDPSLVHWMQSPDPPSADELSQLPIDQRKKLKVLMGHMPFGLHLLLPQETTHITFLRDPIERTISYYSYVSQRLPDDPYYDAVVNKMSLEDYLVSGLFADNGQTRRLAGLVADEPCTTATLDIAINNIRECFSLVGVTEYYDETLMIWKRIFGWSMPLYTKQNVTKKRLRREDVPSSVIKELEDINIIDLELYKHVKDRIEFEIRNQGDKFSGQVKRFKVLNHIYSMFSVFPTPLKRSAKRIFRSLRVVM